MKVNYMFVKIHKAGSTTTACILQRFGYENNLTFVLPMNGGAYVGWPNLFKQEDVIPSEDSFFNVFVNHAIYHKELLENIMAPNTVYLTTLRHPLAHLRSVFNWYHLTKHFKGLEGKDPVESFLKNPTKFEIPYVIHHNKPYSHTKNFMAYNLGFPLGLSDNQSVVADFINRMSRDMHLVLILEHFNESLVLLKRMMCWDVKDILYDLVPKQIKTYNKSSENITRLVVMHRHWSNVDYQLYDHFNATLWNRIENEGDDFSREVRHFKKVLESTATYCAKAIVQVPVKHSINRTIGKLTIPRSVWNDEFHIDPYFCCKLKMYRSDWDVVLQKKHKLPRKVSVTIRESIQKASFRYLNKHLLQDVFNMVY
ncbi:galactosylceramide sulfotransferase-like [Branchiostoma floridae x Branchiostoma belcheri]